MIDADSGVLCTVTGIDVLGPLTLFTLSEPSATTWYAPSLGWEFQVTAYGEVVGAPGIGVQLLFVQLPL